MFERFTTEARAVVIDAQAHARRLRHPRIGTEHLLLALLAAGGRTAQALEPHGVTVAAVEADLAELTTPDADRAALAELGIDLDKIRDATDSTFGHGALERARAARERCRRRLRRRRHHQEGRLVLTNHIPFSRRAKKVLELSLREALRLGAREITAEHIALGLLREGHGLACAILARHDVPFDDLRTRLEASATRAG